MEVLAFLICVLSSFRTKISSPGSARSSARGIQALSIHATSLSKEGSKVLTTKGFSSSSSVAFFQSIHGWNAASQGYPRTISSSPRSVIKKCNPSEALWYDVYNEFQDGKEQSQFKDLV